MRAFVTGASGFVGGWLRAHLEASGDELVGPDHEVDVTDGVAIRDAVTAAAPDAVFHLAALAHVGDSWEAPVETFRVNALGTLHVVQAARACARPPVVLVVGSAEVYGTVAPDQLPVREDQPLRPVTPYAASKAAAEDVALQAHLGFGVPVIRVRAFNHAGPGQAPSFLVSALAKRIAEAEAAGDPTVAVGNLTPTRDFTDVRDIVRAYRLLVERGEPGEVYNVCSGTAVGVREIADRLIALAAGNVELVEDPVLTRPVEVPELRGDNHRLRSTTGWAPSIDLDRTLADTLEWWRAQARTA